MEIYFFSSVWKYLGYVVTAYLTSGGTATLFSKLAGIILHDAPVMYEGSNFSAALSTLAIVQFAYHSHPGGCEVVDHCGFDLSSPND